jgi:hypothetical protein
MYTTKHNQRAHLLPAQIGTLLSGAPALDTPRRKVIGGTPMPQRELLTILVINDNPQFLDLLQRLLRRAHYRTLICDHYAHAYDLIRTQLPDLIFFDIHLVQAIANSLRVSWGGFGGVAPSKPPPFSERTCATLYLDRRGMGWQVLDLLLVDLLGGEIRVEST